MLVSDVCLNSQLYRCFIELPGRRRSADATGMLQTRMFRDRVSLLRRATRKNPLHVLSECSHVLLVHALASLGGTSASQSTSLGIRQAFLFGSPECLLFHQHTLALVAFPRAAEADDHRRERGVLPGASGERVSPRGRNTR